jgi:hypothetical protein
MRKATRPNFYSTQSILKIIPLLGKGSGSFHVKMAPSSLFVFGDQTVEAISSIRHLVRQSRDSPPLQDFLRRITDALQSEISKLSSSERERFTPFDTILGLSETHAKTGSNDVVVSTVLLCVAQLGSLFLSVAFLLLT